MLQKNAALNPGCESAFSFAPSNIALIKYWGKRDELLRLPGNDSISISMGHLGAEARISITNSSDHVFTLNNKQLAPDSNIARRTSQWLDAIIANDKLKFSVAITMNIPLGAGLASSACWFAAICKATARLFAWNISNKQLSILARLGSGSACRSIESGFVHWHAGEDPNGMDSYAENLNITWPELCVGVVMVDAKEKKVNSTEAMRSSVETSPLYSSWASESCNAKEKLLAALSVNNFSVFGEVAENNAIAMHNIIETSDPRISYSLPGTVTVKNKVRQIRDNGVGVYFTQDAGPNIKLLFLNKDQHLLERVFPGLIVVSPFAHNYNSITVSASS